MSTPVNEEQEPAPRSGQVYTDAQGLVSYSNEKDFEELLSQLHGHVEQAIAEDHAEADIARSCIPRTWYCTDGYDATGTDRLFGDKEEQARALFAALSQAAAPFAATAGVVKPNMEDGFAQWKEVATKLDVAEADAHGLVQVAGWAGQAADAYAARTQHKVNEVKAMAALAHATKASVEAVSIMQATVGNAAAKGIHDAIQAALRVKTDFPFDPAGAKGFFSGKSKEELFGYYFYERTRRMILALRTAKAAVNSVGWETQKWRDVARATNEMLITAAEEAQRWQVAQTSYDTNVDVKVWNYSPPDRQSDDQRIKKGW